MLMRYNKPSPLMYQDYFQWRVFKRFRTSYIRTYVTIQSKVENVEVMKALLYFQNRTKNEIVMNLNVG